MLQADLFRRLLQVPPGQHQIDQTEQTEQPHGIHLQATVTSLAMLETHLEHLEGMLNLGT